MRKIIIISLMVFYSGCSADSSELQKSNFNEKVSKIIDSNLKNTEFKERFTTVIEYKNDTAYSPNEDKPFTGVYATLNSNGNKGCEEHFIDGKKNGLDTMWYENGNKASEDHFIDENKNGLSTSWYENGNKASEDHFIDGKENGLSAIWYGNENKKLELNYKNGIETELEATRNEQKPRIVDDNQVLIDNIQEIKNQCQTQMAEYGPALVKSCVDQNINSFNALSFGSYVENHNAITKRCIGQMSKYGWDMVKACADQDIEAENALRKY
jgi:antitoxin component YwqK of YwqJK toxin-antitoxin module